MPKKGELDSDLNYLERVFKKEDEQTRSAAQSDDGQPGAKAPKSRGASSTGRQRKSPAGPGSYAAASEIDPIPF